MFHAHPLLPQFQPRPPGFFLAKINPRTESKFVPNRCVTALFAVSLKYSIICMLSSRCFVLTWERKRWTSHKRLHLMPISSSLSSMRSRTVAVSNGIVLSSPQSKRKHDENSLRVWGFGTSQGLKWIPASPTKSRSGAFCCRCFLNFSTKIPPVDYPQDPLVAYETFWLGVPCEGTWGSTVFFKIVTVDYFSNKPRTAGGWLWGCRVLCMQYTLIRKVQKRLLMV